MAHSRITSFIWSVVDLIRDTFKRGKYQDVILPLTVLRRIAQVLEPTKEKVLKTHSECDGSATEVMAAHCVGTPERALSRLVLLCR